MLKSFLRDRTLLLLLFFALILKLFSLREDWVEHFYTYGFYPVLSRAFRVLFGFLPLSVGDLLYCAAAAWLVVKTWKWLGILFRRQARQRFGAPQLGKLLRTVLAIYLFFNISWGLNYDRKGIASQLGIDAAPYSKEELIQLTAQLQRRLNAAAIQVDTVGREALERNGTLYGIAIENYKAVEGQYPFLRYPSPSTKASLFSSFGHYFGFSGYFNPFTHEAQINTSEPVWVKPFVVNHEIAHQLGYGKENEASFVSFLVSKESSNVDFRYSLYYELYYNAFSECVRTADSSTIEGFRQSIHPRAKRDRLAEIAFRFNRKNAVQPYVSHFYDNYLKLNNQPKGLATYNEVTALLIAYTRKYGSSAL